MLNQNFLGSAGNTSNVKIINELFRGHLSIFVSMCYCKFCVSNLKYLALPDTKLVYKQALYLLKPVTSNHLLKTIFRNLTILQKR